MDWPLGHPAAAKQSCGAAAGGVATGQLPDASGLQNKLENMDHEHAFESANALSPKCCHRPGTHCCRSLHGRVLFSEGVAGAPAAAGALALSLAEGISQQQHDHSSAVVACLWD